MNFYPFYAYVHCYYKSVFKVIAVAGRRQGVFVRPVEQMGGILGGLGTVF